MQKTWNLEPDGLQQQTPPGATPASSEQETEATGHTFSSKSENGGLEKHWLVK